MLLNETHKVTGKDCTGIRITKNKPVRVFDLNSEFSNFAEVAIEYCEMSGYEIAEDGLIRIGEKDVETDKTIDGWFTPEQVALRDMNKYSLYHKQYAKHRRLFAVDPAKAVEAEFKDALKMASPEKRKLVYETLGIKI